MKHNTCNLLANHILDLAKCRQQTATTFAWMYAETNDKKYQETFIRESAIEKELMALHKTVCGYLHKIEEELKVK